MTVELDELYFTWLYSQVDDPNIANPSRTYWKLFRVLHHTEFIPFIPHDENRVEDGKELRYEFVNNSGLSRVDVGWLRLGCSMFELFVGLSRRLAFEGDGEPSRWFWQIMNNTHLSKYTDRRKFDSANVEDKLQRIIHRNYEPDGEGGIFPLIRPQEDQRDVEIWYQAQAYLIELDSLYI